jgi:nitroreductase
MAWPGLLRYRRFAFRPAIRIVPVPAFHSLPMTPISESQLLSALNWRYATKKFDPVRKIPAATWSTLEQALVLSPSSFGLQPWKFIVVDDPAVRQKLAAASWGQTQPVDASHLTVFTVRQDLGEEQVDRHIARIAEVRGGTATAARGVTVESLAALKGMMMGSLAGAKKDGTLDSWQARQVYIALGQFMVAAAVLGIDTCPMEGIVPAQYDEILGLVGTGWTTLCVCPAGYRDAGDKYASAAKVRFPVSEVVKHV